MKAQNLTPLWYSGLLSRLSAVIAGQAETIQKLKQEIEELKEENRKLSDTVAWMHDTIWKLTRGEDSKSGN